MADVYNQWDLEFHLNLLAVKLISAIPSNSIAELKIREFVITEMQRGAKLLLFLRILPRDVWLLLGKMLVSRVMFFSIIVALIILIVICHLQDIYFYLKARISEKTKGDAHTTKIILLFIFHTQKQHYVFKVDWGCAGRISVGSCSWTWSFEDFRHLYLLPDTNFWEWLLFLISFLGTDLWIQGRWISIIRIA